MSNKISPFTFTLIIATGVAIVGGVVGAADATPVTGYRDIVGYNSQNESFATTNFLYNGETLNDKAILLVLKDGGYAGGMDKANPFQKRIAGGHRNQRNLPSEPFGYDIGGLTDDAYVVIDRNHNGTFGEWIGSHLTEAGDEVRWMNKGEIIFTNEDAYGQGTGVQTINVIPEPCTLGLFVLGGMAVALKRARRKNSR